MIGSILLVRPRAASKIEFPFSLLYVGSALKKAGFGVHIIDLHATPEREEEIYTYLKDNPDTLLGITALSASYAWAKEFTLKIKEEFPVVPIVIGGHISVSHDVILNKTGVDYVCLGEGEDMIVQLMKYLNEDLSIQDVVGVAYRDGGEIKKNPIRLIKKEDFLVPEFDLIDVESYLIHPTKDAFFRRDERYNERKTDNDKLATIMFSRGCMGGCNFCYRHILGYRQGAIDWCMEVLDILYHQYGVKYYRIDDELFTANEEWFSSFAKAIEERGYKDILFRASGLRVDFIDKNLVQALKNLGCVAINYGIESGSQEILDKMNKQTTVEQNINAIQVTLKNKIQVMAYVMFGYEDETKETVKETLDMLLKTDILEKNVSLFYTVPLPGTRLYTNCLKKNQIVDEESFMIDLYKRIDNQHERYFIQLGDITKEELFGFEKKFLFLLKLKDILSPHTQLFKIVYKVVFLLPYASKLNYIFYFSRRVLGRLFKTNRYKV